MCGRVFFHFFSSLSLRASRRHVACVCAYFVVIVFPSSARYRVPPCRHLRRLLGELGGRVHHLARLYRIRDALSAPRHRLVTFGLARRDGRALSRASSSPRGVFFAPRSVVVVVVLSRRMTMRERRRRRRRSPDTPGRAVHFDRVAHISLTSLVFRRPLGLVERAFHERGAKRRDAGRESAATRRRRVVSNRLETRVDPVCASAIGTISGTRCF